MSTSASAAPTPPRLARQAPRSGRSRPGQALPGQARPARLRPGSRVAVVAPSGPSDPGLIAEGCQVLAGWGLEVEVAQNALVGHPDLGYLAGGDAARAADLERVWLDPRIEAVLCARGGYGAQRIADRLDWAAMAAVPPKIFTGFSDITALHEAFALRLGVPTLHAPNVGGGSFTTFPQAQQGLRQALFEPDGPDTRVLTCDGPGRLVPGRAAGVTAGGNLSLLVTGLGTADGRQASGRQAGGGTRAVGGQAGDTRAAGGQAGGGQTAGGAGGGFAGCILLLEDVREECYRLDRMLTQLLRSGALDGVAGIVLGTWTDCGPLDAVRQVMQDRLGGLGVPVAWGLQFGHVAPQPTIPLGVRAELDSGAGTLTFLEHAVA